MEPSSPSGPVPFVSLVHAALGHFHQRVIRGANVEARAGDRVLIVGPNGAGKSTLLATLAGLLPVLEGEVRVLGLDPFTERRTVHRKTGFLGHESGFYPELTGQENLTLHARLRDVPHDEVDRQLEDAGLTVHARRFVSLYSHGMKRRLGLAKALLGGPVLLLLDEPDAGLDRNAHARLTAHLSQATQTTVLMATHNPQAHLGWATQAWVLGSERLVEVRGTDTGIPPDPLDAALQEVTV